MSELKNGNTYPSIMSMSVKYLVTKHRLSVNDIGTGVYRL